MWMKLYYSAYIRVVHFPFIEPKESRRLSPSQKVLVLKKVWLCVA